VLRGTVDLDDQAVEVKLLGHMTSESALVKATIPDTERDLMVRATCRSRTPPLRGRWVKVPRLERRHVAALIRPDR
jgi:hypothetical protein